MESDLTYCWPGLQEFHSIPEIPITPSAAAGHSSPGSGSGGIIPQEKPFTAATAAPVGQKTSQKLLLPLPKVLPEPHASLQHTGAIPPPQPPLKGPSCPALTWISERS